MDKTKRLMYAVLIVADACGGNSTIANNSMVSSTLSIIFAKRLSVLVSIVTNAISAIASKKASDTEE
jgi:stress-induced morphogen